MDTQQELANADKFLDQGNYPEAMNIYTRIIDEDPECDEAWVMLGALFGESGDTQKAIEHIEKALSINPQDSHSYMTLGHLKSATGAVDEALVAFKKSAELSPDNTEVLCTLATHYYQSGAIQEAVEHFQKAVDLDDNIAEAWKMLAPLYFQTGNYLLAEQAYQKAITQNQTDPAPFLGYCSMLIHIGRHEEALNMLNKLPDEAKSIPDVLLQMSLAYSGQGLHADAIEHIDNAINKSPIDQMKLAKADILFKKGEIESVFDILKPYLEAKPPNASAVIQLANISDALDLNEECLMLLQSIQQDNTLSPIHRSQVDKAIDWISSLIEKQA